MRCLVQTCMRRTSLTVCDASLFQASPSMLLLCLLPTKLVPYRGVQNKRPFSFLLHLYRVSLPPSDSTMYSHRCVLSVQNKRPFSQGLLKLCSISNMGAQGGLWVTPGNQTGMDLRGICLSVFCEVFFLSIAEVF